ncbi:hypothetical protein HN873_055978 [Arachis hypogaea]
MCSPNKENPNTHCHHRQIQKRQSVLCSGNVLHQRLFWQRSAPIAAHLIAVIHLCAIASNTVFNLAHLLAVASNAVVAAFSKLLQFGFAISITSNRFWSLGLKP